MEYQSSRNKDTFYFSPELMVKSLSSTSTIDGVPISLLLPFRAFHRSYELVARGIKQLENTNSEHLILVSPLLDEESNQVQKQGCEILIANSLNTVHGEIKIDTNFSTIVANKIKAKTRTEATSYSIDLEPVLFSINQVCPSAKMIVIFIGSSECKKASQLAQTIANDFQVQNPVLIALNKLDDDLLSNAEFGNGERFETFTQTNNKYFRNQDLAISPVVAALGYSNEKGGYNFTTIASYQEKDGTENIPLNLTTAMMWNYKAPNLTHIHKKELLQLGFEAIREFLSSGLIPEYQPEDDALKRKSGVFITIRQNSFLRGCIGRLQADEPLYRAVQTMAIAAATSDPRFSPLRLDDLPDISLKIAILSPLQRIDIEQIKLGKHGLLIKHDGRRGVLLPEVPVDRGWDKSTFLTNLCIKAGLEIGILESNPSIYGFTTLEFSI